MAAESLYGGGATFPASAYVGNDFNLNNPISRLSTNAGNTAGVGFTVSDITAGSIFAAYNSTSTNLTSYCQTGSGFGKNSLNGASTALANGDCKDFSTSSTGLSAPTISPDFIGTDSPYSTTDYNNFLAGSQFATHAGVVQIPTIAGAIALPINPSLTSAKLQSFQICRIYSGVLTNWSQLGAGVTGTGHTGPINIVYRTDGSGTTFNFTKYLANTCNGTIYVPAGFVFTPNQTFNSALPGGVTAVYGARAIGASGNPGVVQATTLAANGSAMGYADTSEVVAEGANYVKVNGFDPTKFGISTTTGLPVPISIAVTSLLTGKVLDGATSNPVPGTSSAAIKNCVRLVNPALKFAGYPIVAVTNVAGYYNGNGTAAHVTAIKTLFDFFYDRTNRPVLPVGYAYIDGSATFVTSVKATVNNCIKP
jgi:ABC-type phosphate transport system substrate-binding protein